jgi:maltodextrin utilization protein YvdJ
MSDLKIFLKALKKVGYPNPDVVSIAKMMDYDLEHFLPDLVDEVGEEKADEFTENALNRITPKDGIKVKLYDDPNQFAYIHVFNPRLDLENDETTVLCDWSWGETQILHQDEDGNETYKTISEISEDLGMGDWSEFDELVDGIKADCSDIVYYNCGFGIWWDDQRDIVNNV